VAIAKEESRNYSILIDDLEKRIDAAILKLRLEDKQVRVDIGFAPQKVGEEITRRYREKGWEVNFDYRDKNAKGVVIILNR